MRIEIQTQNFSLTDALRSHVQRRLRLTQARFGEHVQRIVVRLSDINGPRGGEDKRCHVQIILKQLPDVVVEDVEADLYVAIDRASDRASRTVERRLSRSRARERSTGLIDEPLPSTAEV